MRLKDYRFSFQKMLSFKGNTASYMLYSYARISSIVRKLQIDRADIYNPERFNEVQITEEPERVVLLLLVRLDQIILDTVQDLLPHRLCDWMYQLATAYTDFYEKCRVIGVDGAPNWTRLVLCEATRQALRLCFQLLNLHEVERM